MGLFYQVIHPAFLTHHHAPRNLVALKVGGFAIPGRLRLLFGMSLTFLEIDDFHQLPLVHKPL